MEVEDGSVAFKLENFLHVEAVNHALQMNIQFSFLTLRLELSATHQFVKTANILAQVLLEDFLREGCVLGRKNGLCFLIKIFDFVFDSGVYAFVENAEHIILLPHIELDVFEVLLSLEQLPKLQLFQLLQLLPLHQFFKSAQQLKQLFDQQVAHHV